MIRYAVLAATLFLGAGSAHAQQCYNCVPAGGVVIQRQVVFQPVTQFVPVQQEVVFQAGYNAGFAVAPAPAFVGYTGASYNTFGATVVRQRSLVIQRNGFFRQRNFVFQRSTTIVR